MFRYIFVVTTLGGWAAINEVKNYEIEANDKTEALSKAEALFLNDHGYPCKLSWVHQRDLIDKYE